MSDSATFLTWKFNSLSYEDKLSIGLVIDELAKPRAKHPDFPKDIVHQAAIVGEESGELVSLGLLGRARWVHAHPARPVSFQVDRHKPKCPVPSRAG